MSEEGENGLGKEALTGLFGLGLQAKFVRDMKINAIESVVCSALKDLIGEHHSFVLLAVPSKPLESGVPEPEDLSMFALLHLDDLDMAPELLEKCNTKAQNHWKAHLNTVDKH